MIFWYLYAIPCLINLIYYTIPAIVEEVKTDALPYYEQSTGNGLIPFNAYVLLLLTISVLLSWFTFIKLVIRELGVWAHWVLSEGISYRQARKECSEQGGGLH